MIQLAVVGAVIAVSGGVVAVSARDSRIVASGLLLAMVATPITASAEPGAMALAFRLVGAFLAVYLLLAAARAQSVASEGSAIGPVAQAAIALAAFGCGWFVAPVNTLAGPIAAQAGGIALVVLAVVPLSGRNVLRAGTGATVLALGIFLLVEAWVGPAPVLAQMFQTALLIGIAAATSLLISPSELQAQEAVGAAEAATAEAATADTAPAFATDAIAADAVATDASEPTPAREHIAAEPTPIAVVPASAADVPPAPGSTPKPKAARPPRAARGVAKGRKPAPAAKDGAAGAATPESSEEARPAIEPASSRITRLRPREPRR